MDIFSGGRSTSAKPCASAYDPKGPEGGVIECQISPDLLGKRSASNGSQVVDVPQIEYEDKVVEVPVQKHVQVGCRRRASNLDYFWSLFWASNFKVVLCLFHMLNMNFKLQSDFLRYQFKMAHECLACCLHAS